MEDIPRQTDTRREHSVPREVSDPHTPCSFIPTTLPCEATSQNDGAASFTYAKTQTRAQGLSHLPDGVAGGLLRVAENKVVL